MIFEEVISFLQKYIANLSYYLVEIDATGHWGNKLTQYLNDNKKLEIDYEALIALLSEDGQLIDVTLEVVKDSDIFYKLKVSDNTFIDICGTGKEKAAILKSSRFEQQNPALFFWE